MKYKTAYHLLDGYSAFESLNGVFITVLVTLLRCLDILVSFIALKIFTVSSNHLHKGDNLGSSGIRQLTIILRTPLNYISNFTPSVDNYIGERVG